MKLTYNRTSTDIYIQLVANINSFSGDDDENIIEWFTDFEYTSKALGWTDEEKFAAVPLYLKGTAQRWYNVISKTTITTNDCPKDYISLKNRMIEDLCPFDYTSYYCRKLQEAEQQIGQSSISFIYEIYELCLRIHEQTPEIFIVSLIKEKLLPQIKYGVELQSSKTINQLVTSARLAERAMYTCLNPFDTPNEAIDQLKINIKRMEKRLDSFVNRKINRFTRPYSVNYHEDQTNVLQFQNVPKFNEIMIQSEVNNQTSATFDNQIYDQIFDYNNYASNDYPSVNCITTDQDSLFSTTKVDSIHKQEEKRTGLNQTDNSTLSLPTEIQTNADNKKQKGQLDQANDSNKTDQTIESTKHKSANLIQQRVEINNFQVHAMLDTGSEISCISQELVDKLNLQVLDNDKMQPMCVNNEKLPKLGKVKVKIKITDQVKTACLNANLLIAHKLPTRFGVLMGQDILNRLKVKIDCHNKTIEIKDCNRTEECSI